MKCRCLPNFPVLHCKHQAMIACSCLTPSVLWSTPSQTFALVTDCTVLHACYMFRSDIGSTGCVPLFLRSSWNAVLCTHTHRPLIYVYWSNNSVWRAAAPAFISTREMAPAPTVAVLANLRPVRLRCRGNGGMLPYMLPSTHRLGGWVLHGREREVSFDMTLSARRDASNNSSVRL
jgi:hypothetical protein